MTTCTVVGAVTALIDVDITARAVPPGLALTRPRDLVARGGVDTAVTSVDTVVPIETFVTCCSRQGVNDDSHYAQEHQKCFQLDECLSTRK